MEKEEGLQLELETDERRDKYRNQVKKKIILTEVEIIKQYDYTSAKVKKVVNPEEFGFNHRYFGGHIDRCAILKNDPFVLLVDKFSNTLAVFIPDENLTKLTIQELLELCKKYRVEVDKNAKKHDIIQALTK